MKSNFHKTLLMAEGHIKNLVDYLTTNLAEDFDYEAVPDEDDVFVIYTAKPISQVKWNKAYAICYAFKAGTES